MKYLAALLLLVSASASAQAIHFKSVLVDAHNDCVTACIEKKVSLDQDLKGINHSDLARFKQGGVDYQLFSIWCDGGKVNPYAWAMREMDTIDAVAARNRDKMVVAKTWKEIQKALKKNKFIAQYGVEGGHMIEDDINRLDTFYARGVRYMTLTWNNSPSWASSHADEKNPDFPRKKGLNAFGKEIIQRMNQLGIIVDVSHVGEATFWDAIHTTNKPVIASHSNAYSICPVSRNLKDEQIKAVAKNGGVIVNISSILGMRPGGLPQAAYASSKAGLIGLTRDLAAQWTGRKGIRVNALAPGYFPSEMTEDLPDATIQMVVALTAAGRIGRPEELASTLIWLASDASSYVSGVTVSVDGGFVMP